MNTLMTASHQLFSRPNDERFSSLNELYTHCQTQKDASKTHLAEVKKITPSMENGYLGLELAQDETFDMNDWSFSQACSIARVSKDTLNKLHICTARKVLEECFPKGDGELQVYTQDDGIRSINGPRYQRLHNADLVKLAIESASDFQPPQQGLNEASGLYCGQQDMFIFMIDPTGWVEIEGENFAPGFFLWNSEVGRRTVGIQTFWFQAVCRNHIVWDAIDVTEFSRRHIGDVASAFTDIQRIIEALVKRRDERKDGFVQVMRKAMKEKLGESNEEVLKLLYKQGIKQELAKEALLSAKAQGCLTVFSLVDALTRMAGGMKNAGERLELDVKAAALLEIVAA